MLPRVSQSPTRPFSIDDNEFLLNYGIRCSSYSCPTAIFGIAANELTDHCLSTITADALVWDAYREGASVTVSQTVATAIAIEVRWRESDLTAFGDLRPSATWTLASSTLTSSASIQTVTINPTYSSETSTRTAPSTQTESKRSQSAFSLGLGSKVALGLGIPLGSIMILICVFVGYKLRKKRSRKSHDTASTRRRNGLRVQPRTYPGESKCYVLLKHVFSKVLIHTDHENEYELGGWPQERNSLPRYGEQMKR